MQVLVSFAVATQIQICAFVSFLWVLIRQISFFLFSNNQDNCGELHTFQNKLVDSRMYSCKFQPHQSVEVKAVAIHVSNPSILLPFLKMSYVTESFQPHVTEKSG